ncbi:MAG: hypothetical protein R3F30_09975 [Planctomycetota bacterium]
MVFDSTGPDPRHRSYERYLERFAALDAPAGRPLDEGAYLTRLDELDELVLREVEGRLGVEGLDRLATLVELLIEDFGEDTVAERRGREDSAGALRRAGLSIDVDAFLDEDPGEVGGDRLTSHAEERDEAEDEVAGSSLSMGPPSSRARLRRERWRSERRQRG